MGMSESEVKALPEGSERSSFDPKSLMEIVKSSSAAVLVATPGGRILFANPAACRTFGGSDDELRLVARTGLINTEDLAFKETETEPRREGQGEATIPMKRLDGSPFQAQTETAAFTAPDGELLYWVRLRDVTARVRMERRLLAKDEIAEGLLSQKEIPEVMGLVARHARLILDAAEAAVAVPAETGDHLVVVAADGPRCSRLVGWSYPPPSLGHEGMATRQPVMSNSLTEVAQTAEGRGLDLGPAMVVPIVADERVLGILCIVAEKGRHPFSEDDLSCTSQYAQQAGLVLAVGQARAELELHQQRRVDQLEHALESRIVIEQAKGMIAGQRDLSIDNAFQLLRKHARAHSADIHRVATAVVNLGLRL